MGASQAAAVSGLARAAGLAVADIRPDLAGRERCAVLKVA
jgi:hypothetical protein